MKAFKQFSEDATKDAQRIRRNTQQQYERMQQAAKEKTDRSDIVRDTEQKVVDRVKDAVEKSKKKDKPWYELLDGDD